MAITMVEGFDLYNGTGTNTGLQAKWTIGGTAGNTVLSSGRFGGQCVAITNTTSGSAGSGYIQRNFTSTATVGVGVAVNMSALANQTHYFLAFQDSANGYQVGVKVNAAGALLVDRATGGSSGTNLGTTASGVIILGQWHYIELQLTISDTVGTVTLKVDGVSVLSLTSQDTKNTANANVAYVLFGHNGNSAAAACTYKFDDMYLTDTASTTGERKVETVYPTSDVAQGFARSSGATNYTLVDEAQVNGDTDYVQGSTVGDVDTYGLGDLVNTPTTIDAVQVSAFALKTDAGSRSIALQVKSGATTSDGSNYALAASYGKFERLLLTDPNTSSAWTGGGVNALQGGPKVTV